MFPECSLNPDRQVLTYRLGWTLEKSAGSMAATSITTAVAFLANLASFICPVRIFGLWMALLLLGNYLLVRREKA
jgi:hypothetical protein